MNPRPVVVVIALSAAAIATITARADTITVPGDYMTIQQAIAAAQNGDVIEVAPGTHFVNSVVLNKQVSLVSTGGPAVTTLQPIGPSRILICTALGPDVVIEGFTFLDGFVPSHIPVPGAGVFCQSGSALTIRDCIFRSNEIAGTSSSSDGGALALIGSNAKVINCDFVDNTAGDDGGAVYCSGSDAIFIGCRFFGNGAGDDGGAISNELGSNPFLLNCLFSGNTATTGGAVACADAVDRPQFIAHCTFSGNAATTGSGGAILLAGAGGYQTLIYNSILWSNTPDNYAGGVGASLFQFTIINQMLSPPGIGNINANPLFVDDNGADNVVGTEDDNLRVTLGSPAIDSAIPPGGPFAWYCLAADLDGNARSYDHPAHPTTVSPLDRGAYELGAPPALGDCNANMLDDVCETNVIWSPPIPPTFDCNQNNVPDECDIDVNGNGVPDACEFGRCCLDDGSCVEEFVQECGMEGGAYGGPGSTCSITCPQPGACCLDDGSCQQRVPIDCVNLGGSFQGGGVACTTCPQPGACCFDDGSCIVAGPIACANLSGDFEGHGTGCTICPEPGACCFLDGTCDDLTASACAAAEGLFHGRGTSCIVTDCPLPGNVLGTAKISDTQGGFDGVLQDFDRFGGSVTSIGDLDGDGLLDLAIGEPDDADGGGGDGALWIVFMNADGTVRSEQKLGAATPGLAGLMEESSFGAAVANLGDLDGDGTVQLVVSAPDASLGDATGRVWLLHIGADGGLVSASPLIDSLEPNGEFGRALAAIGDLDGDGVGDIAIGVPGGYIRSTDIATGFVLIVLMNANGTVKSTHRVDGPFRAGLDEFDRYGSAVAGLGDLDGDGVRDLAVGAEQDDDGGSDGDSDRGAVWIVFMNSDGTVKGEQKISHTDGGFTGSLADLDYFGSALALVGDLDLDGRSELAVGAKAYFDTGAVWILFLEDDGTVAAYRRIASAAGGFPAGLIDNGDAFGTSLAPVGDVDGDGRPDLAAGAERDDDGGSNRGAVWLLKLDAATTINFDLALEFLAAGAGDFVAAGDLDSDGDPDAVIVIPGTNPLVNGHVQVFLNQGSGGNGGWLGLVAQTPIEVGLQPSGVTVGLFDLDAHLDLAVTNAGDGNVSILINTGAGNGTFAFEQNITVGTEPQAIVSADLNNAGRDDLAVANAASDTVMLITNTTSLPGGSSWMVTATIAVGDEPASLEPEDWEDDKQVGLVVGNRAGGTVDVLFLEFGAPGAQQSIGVGASPIDVSSGDLDGNGFSDIVVALEGDDLVIIPNEGGRVFGAPETIPVGEAPESVEVVDLDSDGDPDLAVVAIDPVIGPSVRVLENFGPPGPAPLGATIAEFGTPLGFAVGAQPNYVVSADFDEDARTDLVTANDDPAGPTGGSVSVLLNLICPADTDGTGDVGFADLTNVLLNWGPCPALPANCPWDLDRNGTVGFNDLTHLLLQWGSCE